MNPYIKSAISRGFSDKTQKAILFSQSNLSESFSETTQSSFIGAQ
jgi:hypothetical protein